MEFATDHKQNTSHRFKHQAVLLVANDFFETLGVDVRDLIAQLLLALFCHFCWHYSSSFVTPVLT